MIPTQVPLRATTEPPPSALLAALGEVARTDVAARKLLVCPRRGIGRELMRALELHRVPWLGFEETTPDQLALELVADALAAEGLARGDQFDSLAALDDAIDDVVAAGEAAAIAELVEGPGFRDAVRRSIEALRLEDLSPDNLRSDGLEDAGKTRFLAATLERYEARLRASRHVDVADVLRRAIDALSSGAASLPHARILVLPDHEARGLRGRFLRLLLARGAIPLSGDPVVGHERLAALLRADAPPSSTLSFLHTTGAMTPHALPLHAPALQLFAAANPSDELREVLRRVLEAGLAWDDVEIVATDADVYGSALDSLARRLNLPVTHAEGLPVERTRPGRAVARYLRWLQNGFDESTLRPLLEAGDLAPAGHDVSGPMLARRMRRLGIGWGRERYLPAIDRALAAPPQRVRDDDAETEARAERERAELRALRALLEPILEAAPPVPDVAREDVRVSPAVIARGVRVLLEHVPTPQPVDARARQKLCERLDRAAATLDRETTFAAALAILRNRLNVHVSAAGDAGAAPWRSAPGHLHFSTLESGGFTARRATFVVGLDAARFPGSGGLDPVLTDGDRVRLTRARQHRAAGASEWETSAERTRARSFALGALLARLRGSVTLSFSAWDPREARALAPASVILQAHRLQTGNGAATYEDLRIALGELAGALPRGRTPLDDADVWLDTLAGDVAPAGGIALVRAGFPDLDRGLRARDARLADTPSAYHGCVRPRPHFDPRGRTDAAVSASALEALGACPLRYFYREILRVRAPDELERDGDAWLDAAQRGTLLHRVYELALSEAGAARIPADDARFLDLALTTLDREADAMALRVPAPSEFVRNRELHWLREDVRAFARMVRDDRAEGAALRATELTFGMAGAPAAEVQLAGGALRIRGRIDRVDRLADGRWAVIDYKTGRLFGYRRGEPFNGGRRIQHALYALAAEALLGGETAYAEYQFPSRRGQNDRARYDRRALADGAAMLDELLDLARAGWFVPTTLGPTPAAANVKPEDCRFCDYARCCRASGTGYSLSSPLAEWAAQRAEGDAPPPIAALVQIRGRYV